MKSTFIISVIMLISNFAFSQNLGSNVQGNYLRPVKKQFLNNPKVMADFCEGYPTNWINNYVSTEISIIKDGQTIKAIGKNDKLTTQQKEIIRLAELGTQINIEVKYKLPNAVTNKEDDFTMEFPLTVIPEVEAEYLPGKKDLVSYLNENTLKKISDADSKKIQNTEVVFTVSELGKVENIKIIKSSGFDVIDKMIVDAIASLQDWKPAENIDGVKVKQEFKYSLQSMGC